MSEYKFKFSLFGKKVQMFTEKTMGVVIEKEPDVVCLYATDGNNQAIYCAVPLCHPKFLKGMEYTVKFSGNNTVAISVGDIKVAFDYTRKRCSNNKGIQSFGSENWGRDVGEKWNNTWDSVFGIK